VFVCDKHSSRDKTAANTAVPISRDPSTEKLDTAAIIQDYNWCCFVPHGVHVQ
jgi:hypothetical protein